MNPYSCLSEYEIRNIADHLICSTDRDMFIGLRNMLTDFSFFSYKCSLDMAYGLMEDYRKIGIVPSIDSIINVPVYKHKYHCFHCPFCLSWVRILQSSIGKKVICDRCHSVVGTVSLIHDTHNLPLNTKFGSTQVKTEEQHTHDDELLLYANFLRKRIHLIASYPKSARQMATLEPRDSVLYKESLRYLGYSKSNIEPMIEDSTAKIDPELMTFMGCTYPVLGCCCSPDGLHVMSSSGGGVIIWSAKTGKLVFDDRNDEIFPHAKCSWSPLGEYCAAVFSNDDGTVGKIKIYRVTENQIKIEYEEDLSFGIIFCAFKNLSNMLACNKKGEAITIFNCDTLKFERENEYKHGKVLPCSFSPDDAYIITGDIGGNLCLWDSRTLEIQNETKVRDFKGHFPSINYCCFSPNGKTVFAGLWGSVVVKWNPFGNQSTKLAYTASDGVTGICFSPNGMYMAMCTIDGFLDLAEIVNNVIRKIGNSVKHGAKINCCCFHPSGEYFVSGSNDKTLKIWEVSTWDKKAETRKNIRLLHSHILCSSYSRETNELILGARNGSIRMLDASTLHETNSFDPLGEKRQWGFTWDAIASCAISSGKDWKLLVGTEFGVVKEFSSSLSLLRSYNADAANDPSNMGITMSAALEQLVNKERMGEKLGVAMYTGFSPDRQKGIAGWSSGEIAIWDTKTYKMKRTRILGNAELCSGVYSPDGMIVALGYHDGTLVFIDPDSVELIKKKSGHCGPINCCAFTPDGRYLATGGSDNTVKIWKTKTLEAASPTLKLRGRVNACAFSMDNCYLVAGDGWGHQYDVSTHGHLTIWDWHTGNMLSEMPFPFLINSIIVLDPELKIALTCDRDVYKITFTNVITAPPIVTIIHKRDIHNKRRYILPGLSVDNEIFGMMEGKYDRTIVCPWCKSCFITDSALINKQSDAISKYKISPESSPCLQLPDEAFEEKSLLTECVDCGKPIRMNPYRVP